MVPWGAVEAVANLATELLRGVPIQQRRATALMWFGLWWPIIKPFLAVDPALVQKIEDAMSGKIT
jgi:hypothetical protein